MLEALSTMKKEFRDLSLCNWLAAYAIYQLEHFTDETAWFEWIYHIRTGMTRCKKETTICSWPGTVMIDQAKSSSRTRSKKEEEEEKEKEREPNMTDPAQPEKRKRKGQKEEGKGPNRLAVEPAQSNNLLGQMAKISSKVWGNNNKTFELRTSLYFWWCAVEESKLASKEEESMTRYD